MITISESMLCLTSSQSLLNLCPTSALNHIPYMVPYVDDVSMCGSCAGPGQDVWDSLVRRFRSLREALVAQGLQLGAEEDEGAGGAAVMSHTSTSTPHSTATARNVVSTHSQGAGGNSGDNTGTGTQEFVREVWEMSVDVCAAARNWPELLKSLHGRLAAVQVGVGQRGFGGLGGQAEGQAQGQQAGDIEQSEGASTRHSAQQWQAPTGPDPTPSEGTSTSAAHTPAHQTSSSSAHHPSSTSTSTGTTPATSTSSTSRDAEFAAAHVLFFACTSSSRVRLDLLAVLRSTPVRVLWHSTEVQYAVSMAAAISSGDFLNYFRLWRAAPSPTLALLVETKLQQVRGLCLRCY